MSIIPILFLFGGDFLTSQTPFIEKNKFLDNLPQMHKGYVRMHCSVPVSEIRDPYKVDWLSKEKSLDSVIFSDF